MNELDVEKYLETLYDDCLAASANQKKPVVNLPGEIAEPLDVILDNPENHKGLLTVAFTSLVYKHLHPEQDIRKHQATIPGGYSGRTFDTRYITPFLKRHGFPAMEESGWLTRSLEHKVPYDSNYTGAIKPVSLKKAFLKTINDIQFSDNEIESKMLEYALQKLIINRDASKILLGKPQNLSIAAIVELLNSHFHSKYHSAGASRLPVLAIYAIYSCLKAEGQKRYSDKELLPLESHTSADSQSGRIGDIQVNNLDGSAFEAVEIKFDIPVSYNIVETAKEKIVVSTAERYYILSTKDIVESDREKIEALIAGIKNSHGCQLIVNGILPTLKYYLRLLDNPNSFILEYVALMDEDKAVKFEHKERWNELVGRL